MRLDDLAHLAELREDQRALTYLQDLLPRQRAGYLHLQLRRQIGDHAPVGLQPAQDEWSGQRPQPLDRPGITARLDRDEEAALEFALGTEQTRVQERHQRPQLAHIILDRRA